MQSWKMENKSLGSGTGRMYKICITIKLNPITKKNSQQILINRATNRPFVSQSPKYKAYEKACAVFIPRVKEPISEPVNVRCIFYRDSRRRVDLSNLISACNDILVKYGVLADDNRNVIYAQDGSRVFYDKNNPRTEITIETISGEEIERWKTNE